MRWLTWALPAVVVVGCGPTLSGGGTEAGATSATDSSATATSVASSGTGTSTSSTGSGTTGPVCLDEFAPCDGMVPCCEADACVAGFCGGAMFIMDPDGGCLSSSDDPVLFHCSVECDVWAQDCPRGEKCSGWANDGGSVWNATICSAVDPNPDQPGDACTVQDNPWSGVDSCDHGAMCWDVDEQSLEGTCVALCTGSADMPVCSDGLGCFIANDNVINLCLPTCDPLMQDCDTAKTCIPSPIGEGFVCVVDASGDSGAAGDACESANGCDPGLFCADTDTIAGCQGAMGCCAPFCNHTDPKADAACPGAPLEECVPWYIGMPPVGFENLGACVIPG